MSNLKQTILRARRREVLNQALHQGAIGLSLGCGLGIVVLLVDRLVIELNVPLMAYLLVAGLGLAAGVVRAIVTHPDLFETALRIDRALDLKDRIATGCVLADANVVMSSGSTGSSNGSKTNPMNDPAFAELVRRDAEHLAGRLDVRTLAPLRITRPWAGVIVLAPLLALGALYLPTTAWAESTPAEPQVDPAVAAEAQRERERVRQSLEETIESLREEADPDDEAAQQELDALERLAEQLDSEAFRPEDIRKVRDESAARVSELADRMEERARRDEMAEQRLLERFAGMETPDPPMSAEEFDRALRRGDFGIAAEELARQLEAHRQGQQDEADELADHLRSMAEELARAQERDRRELEEQRERLNQQLRDHGLENETIDDLLNDDALGRSDIEQMLREEGIDEETLQRLRGEIENYRNQHAVEEQVDLDMDAIREALRQAIEELEQEPQPDVDLADPPLDEPHEEAADDPFEDDPALDEEVHDGEDEAAEPEVERKDDARGDDDELTEEERAERVQEEEAAGPEQQDEDQAERDEREAQEDEDATAEPRADDDTEQAVADDPDAVDDEERASLREEDEQPEPEDDEAADPAAQPDEDDEQPQEEQDVAQQEEQPTPTQDMTEPQERQDMIERQQQQGDEGEPGSCPSQCFRNLDDRRQQGEQRRQQSDALRQRAEDMLADSDGNDAEAIAEQLQEQLAGTGGDGAGIGDEPTPTKTTDPDEMDRERTTYDIDLRDDDVFGELVAEWFSDEPREGETGTTRRELSDEQIRRAREIAERAVDDAAVPARYHDRIRRFFGRLSETIEGSDAAPSPEATDGNGS